MESELTTAKQLSLRETKRRAIVREVETADQAIAARTQVREKSQAESRLSIVEKAAFGVASAFSAVILVICVLLTILGFIFSPITVTLMFGILTAATGISSYVIWRGGQCRKANS